MNVKITPRKLSGEIGAITSKSAAHRALICAFLCDKDKPPEIYINDTSNDIEATKNCLSAMRNKNSPLLDCGDCGATFRLLLPLSVNLCENARFVGSGKLPERPIADLLRALESNGAKFSAKKLPFTVSGKLKSGEYVLPGNISSQFISGLMFALPLLGGESLIKLTTPLESKAYADLTLNTLENFGVEIIETKNGYKVKGEQKYTSPRDIRKNIKKAIKIETDWSNAAFFLTAGAVGGDVTVTGLNLDSTQSDKKIAELLQQFGAEVITSENAVRVISKPLRGIKIDVGEISDLMPILAVAGACAEGETVLYNAARLRFKECDRLSCVCEMLTKLGAEAEETPDSLIIRGGKRLRGGTVDGKNDHRIVMSAAILSAVCDGEIIIRGAEAVEKSYPRFFEDFGELKGAATRIED